MTGYAAFLSAGLTAFIALFLCACKTDKTDPQLTLPADHMAIQAHQTLQAVDGLAVRGDTVSVSICPQGASCFAPNNASARLILSKNGQSNTVRLWTFIPNYTQPYPKQRTDSTSVNFEGKLYKVILRDGRTFIAEANVIQQVIVQVAPL